MCDVARCAMEPEIITVTFTRSEAKRLYELLKAARGFAWKLKDALEDPLDGWPAKDPR